MSDDTETLSQPKLTYCQLGINSVIFLIKIQNFFIQENTSENFVCKMVAIWFRCQCINLSSATLFFEILMVLWKWYLHCVSNIDIKTVCEKWQPYPWEKNWPPWLFTVSSRWPKWSQPAVIEPWLSCDLAVTEPWSYWRCRDWTVTSPWLSCDLAVTELWPRRDWAVTSPSHDWAVIIGPRSRDHRGHPELTVSSRWPFIFSWDISDHSSVKILHKIFTT